MSTSSGICSIFLFKDINGYFIDQIEGSYIDAVEMAYALDSKFEYAFGVTVTSELGYELYCTRDEWGMSYREMKRYGEDDYS